MAGGNSSIIGDAANWPAMTGRSLSGYQQKHVWLNDGAGKFVDVAQAVGVTDTYDGRAVALADLWNRGVLDVVVANQRGPVLLYKNTVSPENKWIEFELEGTKSNRSAIGAEVTVYWNGQKQVQEVSGGSGFAAQNDRRLHFGLGQGPAAGESRDSLAVWNDSDDRSAGAGSDPPREGAAMSPQVIAAPAIGTQTGWKSWLSLENRFVPPVFITLILLVGHLSFGILESYPKTLLAIATSIAARA